MIHYKCNALLIDNNCYYYCRRWTGELEEAIRALQQHIELECDRYFDTIKPNAIKVYSFLAHA